jgi:predicted alpha/beta hydrolase family esterase
MRGGKKRLKKSEIDENSILVGWSAGGAFWVRWLGETKKRVKKLILVAPSKVVGISNKLLIADGQKPIGNEPALQPDSKWERFHNFSTDPEIKDRVDEITIFISNDKGWLLEAAHVYAKELSSKLIELGGQGHFTNAEREAPNFPELIKAISS